MERGSNHTIPHSLHVNSLHIGISDRPQLLLEILHRFLLRLHFTQRFLVCPFEICDSGLGGIHFLLQSIGFIFET